MATKVVSSIVNEYIQLLDEPRKAAITKLHKLIVKSLPKGFEACISYGMIGYVVPHKLYPKGYHCDPKLPLPFMSIANQKNFIALYHMGMYAKKEVYNWFESSYSQHSKAKLDAGKSCIRFKKVEDIPYDLIAELCTKFTVQDWITCYENVFNKK